MAFLDTINHDMVGFSPSYQRENVVWFSEKSTEIFKYADCFDYLKWASGCWINETIPITKNNYRTFLKFKDDSPVYSYLNWEDMTDHPIYPPEF